MSDVASLPPDEIGEVVDALGRKISFRAMNPGDVLDLLEAAGSASGNESYLRYAMTVCSATSIDGTPLRPAGTKDQIRARAVQLGNPGFSALAKEIFGAAAAPGESVTDTAKN